MSLFIECTFYKPTASDKKSNQHHYISMSFLIFDNGKPPNSSSFQIYKNSPNHYISLSFWLLITKNNPNHYISLILLTFDGKNKQHHYISLSFLSFDKKIESGTIVFHWISSVLNNVWTTSCRKTVRHRRSPKSSKRQETQGNSMVWSVFCHQKIRNTRKYNGLDWFL